MLKISKKGKVNAKKTASLYPISYTDLTGDKEVNLKLNIIAPVIDGKKNLSEDVKMDTAFELVTSIPLNAEFNAPKETSMVRDLIYGNEESIGEDGKIHIRGTAVKKGTLKLPFTVNGRKYTLKLKIR